MSCALRLQGLCLVPWVVCVQTGCGSGLTATDTALVGVETEQQRECVDAFLDGGPSAQNACRAVVRATWDKYWAERFDGGANGSGD